MTDASTRVPGVTGAKEIGRGGFGVVYRATESDLGRDVAIKILSGQVDERSQIRFERERRAMGALSGHPNIVTIFRSGITDQGARYLLMEYLPGGSLAERLLTAGPVKVEDTLRIGVELSGALETAHRAGVLHRDVKPENVLVDSLGRAKLGDFGIARLDGSPETKSAVVTASVAHAPPEVIDGRKPDERSDVYSLGSTLYELTSGSPAFSRDTDESMIPIFARIANEPTPDLRKGGVPDAFAAILERAMAKQPDERFNSAADFGRALTDAQRALGHTETPLWLEGEAPPDRLPASATQIVSPSVNDLLAPPSPPVQHVSVAQAPPNSAQAPLHQGSLPQDSYSVPGQNQLANTPQPPAANKSNGRLIVASVIGVLLLVVGVASIARLSGNDDDPPPDGLSGAGPTTTVEQATATTAPTVTIVTTPTTAVSTTRVPTTVARADYLADLPALPSVEQPYTAYRTVGDSGGGFTIRTPVEWVEVLSIEGQVISSADNTAALGNESISGIFVSGSGGLAFWDADLFLDRWLSSSEDLANPCIAVKREPFFDGEFQGLIYAELCHGGDSLVVDVLVATGDLQTVILVAMQMTDERDMAAFQEALASFILFDPTSLPAA